MASTPHRPSLRRVGSRDGNKMLSARFVDHQANPTARSGKASIVSVTDTAREKRWEKFSSMLAGCSGSYIQAVTESSQSSKQPLRYKKSAKVEDDPVKILQIGVPVLTWSSESHRFESRILKVDNRKSFLFLLKQSSKDHRWTDPLGIRLTDIDRVVTGDEALHFCLHTLSLKDPGLDQKTALVISVGAGSADAEPPTETAIVMMAPPSTRLVPAFESLLLHFGSKIASSHILARVGVKAPTAKEVPAAVAKDKDKSKEEMDDDVWWSLDGFRIQNLSKVFDSDPTAELEIKLRALTEEGMPAKRCQVLPHHFGESLKGSKPEEILDATAIELKTLQDHIGTLRPLDRQRLKLAIHEVAIFTKWAIVVSEEFQEAGGLYQFLSEPRQIAKTRMPKADDAEIMREATPAEPIVPDQVDTLCRLSLQSAITALRQMNELEENYHRAFHNQIVPLKTGKRVNVKEEEEQEDRTQVKLSAGTLASMAQEVHLTVSNVKPVNRLGDLGVMSLSLEKPGHHSTRTFLMRDGANFEGSLRGVNEHESLIISLWRKGFGSIDTFIGSAVLNKEALEDGNEGDLFIKSSGGQPLAYATYFAKRIALKPEQAQHYAFTGKVDAVLRGLTVTPNEEHMDFVDQAKELLGDLDSVRDGHVGSEIFDPHGDGPTPRAKQKALPPALSKRLAPRLARASAG